MPAELSEQNPSMQSPNRHCRESLHGAPFTASDVHAPSCPGTLQKLPAGHALSAQHTPSTHVVESHSDASVHRVPTAAGGPHVPELQN